MPRETRVDSILRLVETVLEKNSRQTLLSSRSELLSQVRQSEILFHDFVIGNRSDATTSLNVDAILNSTRLYMAISCNEILCH